MDRRIRDSLEIPEVQRLHLQNPVKRFLAKSPEDILQLGKFLLRTGFGTSAAEAISQQPGRRHNACFTL